MKPTNYGGNGQTEQLLIKARAFTPENFSEVWYKTRFSAGHFTIVAFNAAEEECIAAYFTATWLPVNILLSDSSTKKMNELYDTCTVKWCMKYEYLPKLLVNCVLQRVGCNLFYILTANYTLYRGKFPRNKILNMMVLMRYQMQSDLTFCKQQKYKYTAFQNHTILR